MEGLEVYLNNGWGVTLGFSYHAITAWGFSYNSSVDPDDFENYYTGIYVTDSDDDKTNDPDPDNDNEADEYPDSLRYYDIEYTSGGRWNVLNYYGGSSAIDSFFAFEPMDENSDPEADAGPDQTLNEGVLVTFDGSGSSDPDGDTLTYSWDFDDGGTDSGESPTHTYCDDGSYTVTLTVEDGNGGSDTDTMVVTVNNVAPVAEAGDSQLTYEGETVTFDASSSYDQGTCDTLTYEWVFGDGEIGYGVSPTHVYCDDGDYVTTLYVYDDDGGVDVDLVSTEVLNADPVADAGDDQTVDEGDTVYFTGSSSYDPGTCDILSHEWNFGDGTIVVGVPDLTHIYGDNGVYTATLTVRDDEGAEDTNSITINVNNFAPEVNDLGYYWCDENTVRTLLVQNINDPGSDDITIHWDFGDGYTQTTIYYNDGMGPDPYPSPSHNPVVDFEEYTDHIYGDNGEFTLTVTVTDDDGGETIVTGTVRVDNVLPEIIDFDSQTITENTLLTIAQQAIDQGSDDLTFTWSWGDGTSDTITTYFNNGVSADPYPSPEINPIDVTDVVTHTYGDNGDYTLTLTVTDDDGGSTIVSTIVTVTNVDPELSDITLELPYPDNPGFILPVVHDLEFYATATDQGSDDLTFTWSWGDGTSDTITTYFNNGISADPYPSPEINPIDVTDVVTHTYGDNGDYTLTLTVTDDDGGETIVSTIVTVTNVDPVLSDITLELPYPDNPGFILPVVHDLEFYATATDQGSDDLTFTWDFGDGSPLQTTIYYNDGIGADPYPSPEINPIDVTDTQYHIFSTPGTYTITLTVTDDDGSSATTTFEITILDIAGALDDINDYIQSLPDEYFKGNPTNRKNAMNNMFNSLHDKLEDEEYWGLTQDMNNNIREKCDGHVDGKLNNDWITDPDAQAHICAKIDDLTAYIATYL